MPRIITSRYLGPIFLFLATLIIIIIWFSSTKQIATGEQSLAIFNRATLWSQVWPWQSADLGLPSPTTIVFIFPVLISKSLQYLGMDLWLIQALMYFCLVYSAMLGMFYLSKFIMGERAEQKIVALIAALFYFFNLFTQSQIFSRFSYPGMYAWAYLPIFLLCSIKLLKKMKSVWLLIFALSSIVFSQAYANPVYPLSLWLVLAVYQLVDFWLNRRQRGYIINNFIKLSLLFLIWLLINLWWIIPFKLLVSDVVAGFSGYKYNLDNLIGVSSYYPTQEVMLLRQTFFYGPQGLFASFYKLPIFYPISLMIFVVVIIGALKGELSKRPQLLTIAFVGWFISKGANTPFGYLFFKYLFLYLPFTMVLRNSYEKFGMVWVLVYAILFALGLVKICQKLNQRKLVFLGMAILFLSLCLLVWPMWTGRLYSDITHIKVPNYYSQVNNFLNQDQQDFRVLILPMFVGWSTQYTWGLRTDSHIEFIFDKPSIARPGTGDYQKKYEELRNKFSAQEDYNSLLEEMNVKYLVLRLDIDYSYGEASKAAEVEKTLSKNEQISFIKRIGELSIYEYKNFKSQYFNVNNQAKILNIKRLNPTRYLLTIQNPSGSFNLIFKEAFNEKWKAEINKQKVLNHFKVLGYANAWSIDKTGNFEVEITLDVWPWKDIKI